MIAMCTRVHICAAAPFVGRSAPIVRATIPVQSPKRRKKMVQKNVLAPPSLHIYQPIHEVTPPLLPLRPSHSIAGTPVSLVLYAYHTAIHNSRKQHLLWELNIRQIHCFATTPSVKFACLATWMVHSKKLARVANSVSYPVTFHLRRKKTMEGKLKNDWLKITIVVNVRGMDAGARKLTNSCARTTLVDRRQNSTVNSCRIQH